MGAYLQFLSGLSSIFFFISLPSSMHFLRSATQAVLVLFALVLSIALLYVVFLNPHDHDLGIGLLGLFSNALIGVISFYFGQKGLPSSNTMTATVDIPTLDNTSKNE